MAMTESAQQTAHKTAIRPFQVGFPEAELTDLRRRVKRDQVARARDGHRRLTGRAARDDAGPRALLGRPITTGASARRN